MALGQLSLLTNVLPAHDASPQLAEARGRGWKPANGSLSIHQLLPAYKIYHSATLLAQWCIRTPTPQTTCHRALSWTPAPSSIRSQNSVHSLQSIPQAHLYANRQIS